MEKSETFTIKHSDGKECTYIATSRGLTLEVENLAVKTTLDSTGAFAKFLLGHARIENHTLALLDRPNVKAKKVEIQIRARSSDRTNLNTEQKSQAGDLQVIHTEQDDELNHVDGWTFVLYIPHVAFDSLLEMMESKKLHRLFTHVTPDSFVVDAARRFSSLNMPLDFFAQSSISYGEVSWVSADGDSIDLRAYSNTWTEEEKISAGLVNDSINTKKLLELNRYIKWIAIGISALTVITLFKN